MKEDESMPRSARVKVPDAVYHVMARSITEKDFFLDEADKEHFLDILQTLKELFNCRIFGYCLMSNHYHIILDTNGFDLSDFMKSLNLRYVIYYNKQHNRRGSLLAERFNSKIITNSEYALTLSAYIHNNAKDIPDYSTKVFEYPYSSMGIYLGHQKDTRKLIDTEFILGCVNENDKARAITAYTEMVVEKRAIGSNSKLRQYLEEFKKEQYEYKSYRSVLLRDKNPDEIIKVIAEKFEIEDVREIMHRWKRSCMKFREVVAYALTTLCGMGIKEACEYMKNITGTCLAKLRDRGFQQIQNRAELWDALLIDY